MNRVVLLASLLIACNGKSPLDQTAPTLEPAKDAITKVTENGPVKATVSVWPAKPTLGEPIYWRVAIDAAAGVSVEAPFQEAGDQELGRFAVLTSTRDTQRKPDGGELQIQTYTLDAPSSGHHRIPSLRIEMVDTRSTKDAAKPQEILTEEIPLDIAPVKAEALGTELHAAAGKLDPDVGGTPWMLILVIASVTAMAGSGTVLALRALASRRRLAKQKSAYDDAVAKLRALEERGAPAAELADAWFVELSAIVRNYLERRYDIRAPELTTEEFLAQAAHAAALTPEAERGGLRPTLGIDHRGLLTGFLERCDRVKFAGYRPDPEESIATLGAARGFIEDTRLREPQQEAA